MNFLKRYSFLLGLFLFAFIVHKLDLTQLTQILKTVNYTYLINAGLLLFPLLFFKSLCWNYLKRVQGIKYRLLDSFLMSNIGAALGTLTPGRAGELIKVAYLKKDGYSLGKSLLTVVLDRLSDLLVLALFAYIGLLAIFGSFYKITFYFGLAIAASIVTVLLTKKEWVRRFFQKIFFLIVPQKHQKTFQLNFEDFTKGLAAYKPSDWLIVFLITALSWSAYYCQTFFLARSLGIETISFLSLAAIVTITGLAALLPISILGLGTRESMLILFFSFYAIPKELAVSFSFLVLLLSLSTDVIGLVCFLIKPLANKKPHS